MPHDQSFAAVATRDTAGSSAGGGGEWEAAAEISTNVIGHGAEPVRESIPGF